MTQITIDQYYDVKQQLIADTFNVLKELDPSAIEQRVTVTSGVLDNTWNWYQTVPESECFDRHFIEINLPLVARIVPKLFAWNCMGVQLMKSETDWIETLRVTFRLSEDKTIEMSPYEINTLFKTSKEAKVFNGVKGNPLGTTIEKLNVTAEKNIIAHIERPYNLSEWDSKPDNQNELLDSLTYEILAGMEHYYYLDKIKSISNAPIITYKHNHLDENTPSDSIDQMIIDTCNRVAPMTRRGAGNWAIINPTLYHILQKQNSFVHTDKKIDTMVSIEYQGVLNGNIKIFVNQYASSDTPVLVGYKGSMQSDAGFFLGLYLPITMNKFGDFFTQTAIKSLPTSKNALGLGTDYFYQIGVDVVMLKSYWYQ